ncbi:Gag protease polyprotein [Gossypium australe]|uniref:Gag protease polyprotein n=1 Tax=Gossypium australe TaxID=47621 RepID=A0A5B6WSJ0_9ROSI|nr:Gag protease polyprotein [Gossypium australe]
MSKNLGVRVEEAITAVTVLSPVGQLVIVHRIYKRVVFLPDLMELPFWEFDLILGMDWLVQHKVNLDCAIKRVKSRTTEGREVVMFRERRGYLSNVVVAMVVEKLIQKGYGVYLAYVLDGNVDSNALDNIHTLKNFPDVFPEELPRIAPDREVEFKIKLIPGTNPVSIAPYRMAPNELHELKIQLQELLECGFIRPSISPWGA